MRDAGRFIVLEGGDGVGKSTQVALLSAWLGAREIDHVVAREPGGTAVGEAIREIVLGRRDLHMPAESELLLILAARAAFLAEVVRPALAGGKVVVADRYSLSTLAYQGFGRGLDLGDVREAIRIATAGLKPDMYVVLDLPAEEVRDRTARNSGGPDRIEQEGDDFRRRVREGYLALAEGDGTVHVVDARGAPEHVHVRIRRLLEMSFVETFGATAV